MYPVLYYIPGYAPRSTLVIIAPELVPTAKIFEVFAPKFVIVHLTAETIPKESPPPLCLCPRLAYSEADTNYSRQGGICMNIPAAVTIYGLWVDHNESFLVSESLEVGASIESVCISVTPVNPDNDRRIGDQILRHIEPRADRSRICAKVCNLLVCGTRE